MSEVDPVGLEGPTKPKVLAVSSSDLVRRHAVQSEQGARAVLSDLFEMSAIIGRVISNVAASRIVIIRRGPRPGGLDLGFGGVPVPRQQLRQPRGWYVGDAGDDVGEPGLRVDVVELGGADQRVHGGGALSAALGPGEEP